MKTWFDYCYYRISKAYKFFDSKGYYISAGGVCAFTLAFIALALIKILFYFLKYDLTTPLIICVCIPFATLGILYIDPMRYEKLCKKYKNEKYSKLKGWLVFLYVISSFILYFVSLYVFEV